MLLGLAEQRPAATARPGCRLTDVDVTLLDDDHLAVDLVDNVVNGLAGGQRNVSACGLGAAVQLLVDAYTSYASESISSPVRMSSKTSIVARTFGGVGGLEFRDVER